MLKPKLPWRLTMKRNALVLANNFTLPVKSISSAKANDLHDCCVLLESESMREKFSFFWNVERSYGSSPFRCFSYFYIFHFSRRDRCPGSRPHVSGHTVVSKKVHKTKTRLENLANKTRISWETESFTRWISVAEIGAYFPPFVFCECITASTCELRIWVREVAKLAKTF